MSVCLTMPEPFAAEIESLAEQLAEAMANASAVSQTLSAAEAHRDQIAGRISELAERRGAIVARRAGGGGEADDGATLALIGADTDSLQSLMPDAANRVAEARKSFDFENAMAAKLRGQIGQVEAAAVRQVLIGHCDVLVEKFLETLKALEVASQRANAGGRPAWCPGAEFRNKIRKISLECGEF